MATRAAPATARCAGAVVNQWWRLRRGEWLGDRVGDASRGDCTDYPHRGSQAFLVIMGMPSLKRARFRVRLVDNTTEQRRSPAMLLVESHIYSGLHQERLRASWLSGVLGDHGETIPIIAPFVRPIGGRTSRTDTISGDSCRVIPCFEPASPRTPESHEERKPYRGGDAAESAKDSMAPTADAATGHRSSLVAAALFTTTIIRRP